MAGFFLPLLLGLGLSVVGYILMSSIKQPKPPAARDQDSPTAEPGKPIPVIFGTMTVKGVNVLWYGQKSNYQWEKDV